MYQNQFSEVKQELQCLLTHIGRSALTSHGPKIRGTLSAKSMYSKTITPVLKTSADLD